jgi:hypothetical protein
MKFEREQMTSEQLSLRTDVSDVWKLYNRNSLRLQDEKCEITWCSLTQWPTVRTCTRNATRDVFARSAEDNGEISHFRLNNIRVYIHIVLRLRRSPRATHKPYLYCINTYVYMYINRWIFFFFVFLYSTHLYKGVTNVYLDRDVRREETKAKLIMIRIITLRGVQVSTDETE